MFVFGHVGIGSWLARPLARPGELRWLVLGTLLPDLLDKPLYYGLVLATSRRAADLGLISGTRTFGHTLLAALLVLLAVRGRRGAMVALGMATHLLLDLGGDLVPLFAPASPAHAGPSTIAAVRTLAASSGKDVPEGVSVHNRPTQQEYRQPPPQSRQAQPEYREPPPQASPSDPRAGRTNGSD